MGRVLVTGVTGQDGPYLAQHLVSQGHSVWGMVCGQQRPEEDQVLRLVPGLRLVRGDVTDLASLYHVIRQVRPEAVYNLAALSFVGTSWEQPAVTARVTGLGCLNVLDAIRHVNPEIRFVQASSSEMFGDVPEVGVMQDEDTPFAPQSPYAIAKVFAHHVTVNYRQSYGMHASTAIMFNHESPRRGTEFVTRKVSKAVAEIRAGLRDGLVLGNLAPCRDWGWAPEYMKALPLMTQRDEPGDWVLATGESHSVERWCEAAFSVVGLDWREYVTSDPRLFRPAEVGYLRGNADKAWRELGWAPAASFGAIVHDMVTADILGLAGRIDDSAA